MSAINNLPGSSWPPIQNGKEKRGGLLTTIDWQRLDHGLTGIANVRDYGATGDGTTDDSAAIQAAINTGLAVYFPPGVYACHGLTQATTRQALFGHGALVSYLIKNANGALLTCTGDNIHLEGLGFRGDAATPTFTGDNLVISGGHPLIRSCGSQWAYGRALKATGAHVQVYGSEQVWQTADATATGYDIELGVSGTATLYHELHGIYTSQSTGGILATDVGALTIVGGQYGKLNIAAGTSPAGSGVVKVHGSRITGAVTVGLSSTVFAGNAFSAVAITFNAGTSGCVLGPDNVFGAGYSVVNNGNANNLILRGTATAYELQLGQDSAPISFIADPGNSRFRFPGILLGVQKLFQGRNAADSGIAWQASSNGSDNLTFSNLVSGKTFSITAAGAGGVIALQVNGVNIAYLTASGIRVMSSTGPYLTAGSGSPEGVVTAPVGSLYMRTDGGAGTSMYVKESGAGNTGWVGK